MTEYTPSLEEVRDATSLFRSRFFDHEEFNRWYESEIAAAEQRGAIKALREAAEDSGLIDYMYKYFAHPHLHAPPTVRAASSYLHDRADQENTDA